MKLSIDSLSGMRAITISREYGDHSKAGAKRDAYVRTLANRQLTVVTSLSACLSKRHQDRQAKPPTRAFCTKQAVCPRL